MFFFWFAVEKFAARRKTSYIGAAGKMLFSHMETAARNGGRGPGGGGRGGEEELGLRMSPHFGERERERTEAQQDVEPRTICLRSTLTHTHTHTRTHAHTHTHMHTHLDDVTPPLTCLTLLNVTQICVTSSRGHYLA